MTPLGKVDCLLVNGPKRGQTIQVERDQQEARVSVRRDDLPPCTTYVIDRVFWRGRTIRVGYVPPQPSVAAVLAALHVYLR